MDSRHPHGLLWQPDLWTPTWLQADTKTKGFGDNSDHKHQHSLGQNYRSGTSTEPTAAARTMGTILAIGIYDDIGI